ncbi:MAG TPA: response regulator transcription factor [Polyangia bacterium]
MAITVLLVDDNLLFRGALRALLEGKEELAVVGEAGSAAEAVSLLDANPDVVITDRYLPDVDGIELTRQIKQRRPDTTVLLLSGLEDPGLGEVATAAGVSAMLNKGKSLVHLVPMISRLVAQKRKATPRMPSVSL